MFFFSSAFSFNFPFFFYFIFFTSFLLTQTDERKMKTGYALNFKSWISFIHKFIISIMLRSRRMGVCVLCSVFISHGMSEFISVYCSFKYKKKIWILEFQISTASNNNVWIVYFLSSFFFLQLCAKCELNAI